tara:strand:+ start:281 stop:841 length:561 start_codon:yes stop_codon:yes gene_type:complete
MTPRNAKNVISLKKWREKTFTDVYVFDIDNTIFESVGTYEKDYNLDKFQKDNTFFRNLFLKKLPLFYAIKNYYGKYNKLVVIQTARQKKWWLPLLLWIKGVRYDYLMQRPISNTQDSGKLKRTQLVNLILWRKIKIGNVFFIDDDKQNRDEIQTLDYALVFNAEKLNRTVIEKEIQREINSRFGGK